MVERLDWLQPRSLLAQGTRHPVTDIIGVTSAIIGCQTLTYLVEYLVEVT